MTATSNPKKKRHMTDECFAALKPLFQHHIDDLLKAPASVGGLPKQKGLYALSENGTYLYVGMTKNLRNRWQMHRYGDTSAASFAVKLARDSIEKKGGWEGRKYTPADGLKALRANKEFRDAFEAARERIRRMDMRFLEWGDGDDGDLAVLEIFAAHALKTPYNDFRTS